MSRIESGKPPSNPTEIAERRDNLVKTLFTSHITRLREHRGEFTTDGLIGHVLGRAEIFGTTGLAVVSHTIDIANRAHSTQKRKFSEDPYLIHPLRVALLAVDIAEAMGVEVTPQFLASAVLHDVPEDNPEFTKESITKVFQKFEQEMPGISKTIGENAEALNHNNHLTSGHVERIEADAYFRKIMSLENVEDPNTLVYRKIIKIADRIDNLIDPLEMPRNPTWATELIRTRTNYINRTGDKGKVIMLLINDEPFLTTMIEMGEAISQKTLPEQRTAHAA